MRCLNNLGMALISMRQMAGAMEVLLNGRSMSSTPIREILDDMPDDIVYIVVNLVHDPAG